MIRYKQIYTVLSTNHAESAAAFPKARTTTERDARKEGLAKLREVKVMRTKREGNTAKHVQGREKERGKEREGEK